MTVPGGRAASRLAIAALAAGLALVPAASGPAEAAASPITLTVVSGTLKAGSSSFDLQTANPLLSLSGTLDASGALAFPAAGLRQGPITTSAGVLASVALAGPATGSVNAATGAASIRLRFKIALAGGPAGLIPPGCSVGTDAAPIDVKLTSGAGTPYSAASGRATLAAAPFTIPAPATCGAAGNATIAATMGLPAAPAATGLRMTVSFDPRPTAASGPGGPGGATDPQQALRCAGTRPRAASAARRSGAHTGRAARKPRRKPKPPAGRCPKGGSLTVVAPW